jgi:hypothetical protein
VKNILFSDKRKFFYDCEFMELPGYLKLISIGVVGEQPGQEFYACNSDALPEFKRANSWVKNNVIPRLPPVQDRAWKTEKEIQEGLSAFLGYSELRPVELWSYFSDYDHVLLCWLFGRMVDLPDGMPMYTLDLKQLMYHIGVAKEDIPIQKGEAAHDALKDARYHKELYDYLINRVRFDL